MLSYQLSSEDFLELIVSYVLGRVLDSLLTKENLLKNLDFIKKLYNKLVWLSFA